MMATCPEKIVNYMHDYLDGEITHMHEQELHTHLKNCSTCRQHMDELNKTVAFLKSATTLVVPVGFTQQVMYRLPKQKIVFGAKKWIRRHPMLIAIAVFSILMSASLWSGYQNDQEFTVTKNENLLIEGQTVTVPENVTINENIIVKNGDLVVKGKVDGDITVINGQYMASTANVTGQVEEIDKAFEWLWFTIKNNTKKLLSFE